MGRLNHLDRLDNDALSAVLARVAYAVAKRRWRLCPPGYRPPAEDFVSYLSRALNDEGFSALSMYLSSMAYAGRLGVRGSAWRDTVVCRARAAQRNRERGQPWKRLPPCY